MTPKRFKITSPLMPTPDGGKRVCRPTKWGNRMTVSEAGSNKAACDWFELHQCTPEFRELARRELKGLDLGCYCDLDQPCHADILLRIANGAPDR